VVTTDARDAISRQLFAYAELVDAGDFAGVSQLFEHATYRAVAGDQIGVRTGAAEVQKQFEKFTLRHEDGTPSTKHVITNVVVEVEDGATSAKARSYFTVLQARPTLPLQAIVAGRYHDEFAVIDGAWRFTDRLIITDMVGDISQHLSFNPYA
jgi:3-phenylpropionate/cinnamic acid dioxygenase small subunit